MELKYILIIAIPVLCISWKATIYKYKIIQKYINNTTREECTICKKDDIDNEHSLTPIDINDIELHWTIDIYVLTYYKKMDKKMDKKTDNKITELCQICWNHPCICHKIKINLTNSYTDSWYRQINNYNQFKILTFILNMNIEHILAGAGVGIFIIVVCRISWCVHKMCEHSDRTQHSQEKFENEYIVIN